MTVEGDADQLADLSHVNTLPVSLAGASSDVSVVVSLDLPTGVVVLGSDAIRVTVTLRPITATRSFDAGLRLIGTAAGRHLRPLGRPGPAHDRWVDRRPRPPDRCDDRGGPGRLRPARRVLHRGAGDRGPAGRPDPRRIQSADRDRDGRRIGHRSAPTPAPERRLTECPDCSGRTGSVASPTSTSSRPSPTTSVVPPRAISGPTAARSSSVRTPAGPATCSSRPSRPAPPAWASTSTRSASCPTPGPGVPRRPRRCSSAGSWSRRRTTRPTTTASRSSTATA